MTKETEIKPGPLLTSKQKKFLKGLGHHLSPVISIGKDGLEEKIISATNLELARHELIKVKLGKNSPAGKEEAADYLLAHTGSSLVQIIGKTILLYKKNPKLDRELQIKLP